MLIERELSLGNLLEGVELNDEQRVTLERLGEAVSQGKIELVLGSRGLSTVSRPAISSHSTVIFFQKDLDSARRELLSGLAEEALGIAGIK